MENCITENRLCKLFLKIKAVGGVSAAYRFFECEVRYKASRMFTVLDANGAAYRFFECEVRSA